MGLFSGARMMAVLFSACVTEFMYEYTKQNTKKKEKYKGGDGQKISETIISMEMVMRT